MQRDFARLLMLKSGASKVTCSGKSQVMGPFLPFLWSARPGQSAVVPRVVGRYSIGRQFTFTISGPSAKRSGRTSGMPSIAWAFGRGWPSLLFVRVFPLGPLRSVARRFDLLSENRLPFSGPLLTKL